MTGDDGVFLLTVVNDGEVPSIRAVTPPQVVTVRSPEDLDQVLQQWLSFDTELLEGSRSRQRQLERLRYVEEVRPALRYYCKKLGTETPDWLKDGDRWDGDGDDVEKLFGVPEVHLREFAPLACPDIAVVRDQQ